VLAVEMVWLGLAVEVSALAGAGREGGHARCGCRHGRARCARCGHGCGHKQEAEAVVRRCRPASGGSARERSGERERELVRERALLGAK
jgi:hypothetical protein